MEEVQKTGELAKNKCAQRLGIARNDAHLEKPLKKISWTKKQKPPESVLNASEKGLVARIQGELKHKLAAPAAATSKKNKPSEWD